MATTIKVSTETRDRIKAFGGDTYEDTIVEALDALDKERFWAEADAAIAWRRDLPPTERARIDEQDRAESAAIDRAFDAFG